MHVSDPKRLCSTHARRSILLCMNARFLRGHPKDKAVLAICQGGRGILSSRLCPQTVCRKILFA